MARFDIGVKAAWRGCARVSPAGNSLAESLLRTPARACQRDSRM